MTAEERAHANMARARARAKGNEFQRWCARFIEKHGWSVYNQTPVTRVLFIGGKRIFAPMHKDIFGADLIAIKEDEPVLFVQATLDSHVEKREAEFNKYHRPRLASFQLWMKREGGDVAVSVMNEGHLEQMAYIRRGKWVPINDCLQFEHPRFDGPVSRCAAASSDAPSTGESDA